MDWLIYPISIVFWLISSLSEFLDKFMDKFTLLHFLLIMILFSLWSIASKLTQLINTTKNSNYVESSEIEKILENIQSILENQSDMSVDDLPHPELSSNFYSSPPD